MKVFLAFGHISVNTTYQLPLWRSAVQKMGWQECKDIDDSDIVITWGVNPEAETARTQGKQLLMIDFPYWNRDPHRRGKEFYKISVAGQHPTQYIMKEKHSVDRYKATCGPAILPWKTGGKHIMIAGMGVKSARQYGYRPGEWEEQAFRIIRPQTFMPILYRPKPRQHQRQIRGALFDDGKNPIEPLIADSICVVCHHGNPTVDALAMGVPVVMNGMIGVAAHFANYDLYHIHDLRRYDGREQFFYNLSHWQWSVEEIKSASVLISYLDRGLIGEGICRI